MTAHRYRYLKVTWPKTNGQKDQLYDSFDVATRRQAREIIILKYSKHFEV
jgi:hypothetical protein